MSLIDHCQPVWMTRLIYSYEGNEELAHVIEELSMTRIRLYEFELT